MIQFYRRLTLSQRVAISIFSATVLVFSFSYLVQIAPRADDIPHTAVLTISDSQGIRQQSIGNLYTMRLTSGDYTIQSTVPQGNTVWYSACTNCTDHAPNSYTFGSRARFSVKPNEFIDLVWYYTPKNSYVPYRQIVDCSVAGNCQATETDAYAYGPSIIKKDGTYHAFFCTKPDLGDGIQDYIRYTSSQDGRTWTKPEVAVAASNAVGQNGLKSDKSACDPSLVFYKGYYYLYYSGAYETGGGNNQTVIQVARSQAIAGPYQKYTERGTWEEKPADPKHIIRPMTLRATPDTREQHFYGAGQPSVIEKDGKLFMWYLDDSFTTVEINGETFGEQHVYLLESTEPAVWTPEVERRTNLGSQHGKYKYDAERNQFVNFRDNGSHSRDSQFELMFSAEGLIWGAPISVISKDNFPNFSHNLGISGDQRGWTIAHEDILIGFAAPYDLSEDDRWGVWDLYGFFYNYHDAILLPDDEKIIAATATPEENRPTVGHIDGVDGTGTTLGWAVDPNDSTKPIVVQFYLDGHPSEGGSYIGAVLADQESFDVASAAGYTGNHRYAYSLPEKTFDGQKIIRDGKPHTIYAVAIDNQNPATGNTILIGSGSSFTANIVATPVPATPTPALVHTPNTSSFTPSPTPSAKNQLSANTGQKTCRRILFIIRVCR